MAAEEEFSAITDKIPQRPVTVVEGTSYTLVIIAALGVSGGAGEATNLDATSHCAYAPRLARVGGWHSKLAACMVARPQVWEPVRRP